jgi:osmotically inducible protein OsmC
MIERQSNAQWNGDLKGGSGSLRLGSGAFEGKYSFGTRFESAPGTNPEELLAAAHAACFTMALANALAGAGHVATQVRTTAKVQMDKVDGKNTIVGIALSTEGEVPGISAAEFAKHAEAMKAGCIVSRALAAVPMTLTATLK